MKYFLTTWTISQYRLCGDNDGSGQSQEGPAEGDETVGEEPGQQETVLMFVSQLQVLSPGGGQRQEGRIFPEARQTQRVEESQEYEDNTCNQN